MVIVRESVFDTDISLDAQDTSITCLQLLLLPNPSSHSQSIKLSLKGNEIAAKTK